MKCSKCGKVIEVGDFFCMGCGATVDWDEKTTPTQTQLEEQGEKGAVAPQQVARKMPDMGTAQTTKLAPVAEEAASESVDLVRPKVAAAAPVAVARDGGPPVKKATTGKVPEGEWPITFEAKYRDRPFGILASILWWIIYITRSVIFLLLTGWRGEDIAKCTLTPDRLEIVTRTFKNWPLWLIPMSEDRVVISIPISQINQVNYLKRKRFWAFRTRAITLLTVERQGSLQAFKSKTEREIEELFEIFSELASNR